MSFLGIIMRKYLDWEGVVSFGLLCNKHGSVQDSFVLSSCAAMTTLVANTS